MLHARILPGALQLVCQGMTTLLGSASLRPVGHGSQTRWLSSSSVATTTREIAREAPYRAALLQHSIDGRQSCRLVLSKEQMSQQSADAAQKDVKESVFVARSSSEPESCAYPRLCQCLETLSNLRIAMSSV